MQAKYFFSFIVSFIVGVAIEEVFGFGFSFAVLCVFLSVIVFLLRDVRLNVKGVIVVSFILFGTALGVFRVDIFQMKQKTHILDTYVENVAEMRGIILSEPDVRESYTNIVLDTHSVLYHDMQSVLETPVSILVRVPSYPEFQYGDEVTVLGKITTPKNFAEKDNAKSFDYRAYLAKDNIFYQMYFPKVSFIAEDRGNIVREKLFNFKTWLRKNIAEFIPEPEASLAGGVLLGAKQSLGDELLQKFRETGVAHIIVLSGYNIAVVAGVISRMSMFMPFAVRVVASVLGIILFAFMVGGEATVVRATLMALIVILARALGREGDALRALVLVGGVMVAMNPMILLHDVSFQLSFLATLALIIFVPCISKYFVWVKSMLLREILVTTTATQIFVLPIILYHMGSVSLIGFFTNIFVLPVVPLAMFVVALLALFAWIPLVNSALAFVGYLTLAYIIFIVELFAKIPLASLSGISFSLIALILAYFILGFYIIKNFPRAEQKLSEKKSTYDF